MINQLINQTEQDILEQRANIQQIAEHNQYRVLQAFRTNKISDSHFQATTGYGYDDFGREGLEKVYADVFGTEDALVRPQLISGTHAITTALFGVLRPNDQLLYITGEPYDTLEEVIGTRGEQTGSLMDFGISYQAIPLVDGEMDKRAITATISDRTKVIAIQRSKGYADRPSFTVSQIEEMINFVRTVKPDVIVFVDNCYGEFVEKLEPTHVGADLIAGSLIKNPGGGLARIGGYIAGRQDLIALCANRLTAPGLGKETGASLGILQEMYQGFFLAPHTVAEALQGALFTARLLELAGFKTTPHYLADRTDLIQSVTFSSREQMIAFCQAIQHASPINGHVTPYPAEMPGYESEVIMAAGTFIQGASLELTADGPLRPPYTAFVQGGLVYSHVKLAVSEAVAKFVERGYLKL
ncbi:Cystathionine beta-lyase family protein involved in aluminum resistance [Amphibacillus marinus]|uniref:Cystathionine beta-lyase family protein involved in aluminum resistance n=1 Tax=Amphibacillus marinus TaxID=872970 RepID=A0A1H8HDP0_9BACI|nr:methionine gamma-lyase family protein [Amphibacillus marinus]SEN54074.1 Cystathionine beta-lyase family protein involved in aluminum resistance [Amphibacillus marinus]